MIDLYFIGKKYQISIDQIINDIIIKIRFALERNQQYNNNFLNTEKTLRVGSMFNWGDEKKYILTPLNQREFATYVGTLENKLRSIIELYYIEAKK